MIGYRIIALLLIAAGLTLVPCVRTVGTASTRSNGIRHFDGAGSGARVVADRQPWRKWFYRVALPALLLAAVGGLYARPVNAATAAGGASACGRGR